jgi:nitrogen-specific signal transduction histidine kinase
VRSEPAPERIAPAPFLELRERLVAALEPLDRLAPEEAGALRAEIDLWWQEQQVWNDELSQVLALHHEINNALVGVRGTAQLLMIGPAGQLPGVKERLEVMVRESERIQQAASRIRGLKNALGPVASARRAA